MAKKPKSKAEVDKYIADMDARVAWKGDQTAHDDVAVRYVAYTLQTAEWIAHNVFGSPAASKPEVVFAIYDRIAARARYSLAVTPGPIQVPENPEDTETPGPDTIPGQPKSVPL